MKQKKWSILKYGRNVPKAGEKIKIDPQVIQIQLLLTTDFKNNYDYFIEENKGKYQLNTWRIREFKQEFKNIWN